MNPDTLEGGQSSGCLSALRRFARPRAARERCELCDAELADDHAHLIELATRRLACACDGLRLALQRPRPGRYRRVPRRVQFLADFVSPTRLGGAAAADQSGLLPGALLAGRVVALYPSPAGATESLVPLEHWQALAADQPGPRDARAGRRGAAGQPGGRGVRILPRGHRRVLQAGRPDPHCTGEASRAGQAVGRDRPLLRWA